MSLRVGWHPMQGEHEGRPHGKGERNVLTTARPPGSPLAPGDEDLGAQSETTERPDDYHCR